jgi:hypothetical protein
MLRTVRRGQMVAYTSMHFTHPKFTGGKRRRLSSHCATTARTSKVPHLLLPPASMLGKELGSGDALEVLYGMGVHGVLGAELARAGDAVLRSDRRDAGRCRERAPSKMPRRAHELPAQGVHGGLSKREVGNVQAWIAARRGEGRSIHRAFPRIRVPPFPSTSRCGLLRRPCFAVFWPHHACFRSGRVWYWQMTSLALRTTMGSTTTSMN